MLYSITARPWGFLHSLKMIIWRVCKIEKYHIIHHQDIRYNILVSEYCINILPFPPLPLESRSCWETGLIFARICGTQGCTGFSITETRATAEGFGAVQSCKIPINEWCVLWYVWKCQYLVRIQKFIIYIYINYNIYSYIIYQNIISCEYVICASKYGCDEV